jgi:hypothetical protein
VNKKPAMVGDAGIRYRAQLQKAQVLLDGDDCGTSITSVTHARDEKSSANAVRCQYAEPIITSARASLSAAGASALTPNRDEYTKKMRSDSVGGDPERTRHLT